MLMYFVNADRYLSTKFTMSIGRYLSVFTKHISINNIHTTHIPCREQKSIKARIARIITINPLYPPSQHITTPREFPKNLKSSICIHLKSYLLSQSQSQSESESPTYKNSPSFPLPPARQASTPIQFHSSIHSSIYLLPLPLPLHSSIHVCHSIAMQCNAMQCIARK